MGNSPCKDSPFSLFNEGNRGADVSLAKPQGTRINTVLFRLFRLRTRISGCDCFWTSSVMQRGFNAA